MWAYITVLHVAMCKSHLSFPFVPALYYTLTFFIYLSPHFLCCGMYEEYCLPTNCDNVVSCIKTLSLCRVPCVSVPPILSYINLNIQVVVQQITLWECYCLQIVVCCGLKRNCGDIVK